jgi:anti-sigma B factor antagonist
MHPIRVIAYTVPTMPFDSPLNIERISGAVPGTLILRLTGPLTLVAAVALRDQLRDAEKPRLIILDLTGVPYVDSAGMSEIIHHELYCRDNNARLVVTGVNHRVMEMLKTTHLDKILTLKPTVEEAEAGA